MALAQRHIPSDCVLPFKAESDITKYAVCINGAGLASAKMPTAADPTSGVAGVAMNAAKSGDDMSLATDGCIVPVVANAAIAKGALLSISGVDGRVKTAAPGAGVSVMIVGEALEAAAAGGDVIAMRVRMFQIKG